MSIDVAALRHPDCYPQPVDHVEIDVRAQASIEPQLLAAEMLAQRWRAEVEERQRDGLLQLVGPAAGQAHDRDVRLCHFHVIDRLRVAVVAPKRVYVERHGRILGGVPRA